MRRSDSPVLKSPSRPPSREGMVPKGQILSPPWKPCWNWFSEQSLASLLSTAAHNQKFEQNPVGDLIKAQKREWRTLWTGRIRDIDRATQMSFRSSFCLFIHLFIFFLLLNSAGLPGGRGPRLYSTVKRRLTKTCSATIFSRHEKNLSRIQLQPKWKGDNKFQKYQIKIPNAICVIFVDKELNTNKKSDSRP